MIVGYMEFKFVLKRGPGPHKEKDNFKKNVNYFLKNPLKDQEAKDMKTCVKHHDVIS